MNPPTFPYFRIWSATKGGCMKWFVSTCNPRSNFMLFHLLYLRVKLLTVLGDPFFQNWTDLF